jgi:hypothetical protein
MIYFLLILILLELEYIGSQLYKILTELKK